MNCESYNSFVSYYGGTSPETLRQYAVQSETQGEIGRAAMFVKLAKEQEQGVKFIPDNQNSKLSYRRIA